MPSVLRVRSYAKINWYLGVLSKRSDGYHELNTLFQRIDLYDTLIVRSHPSELTVVCRHPQLRQVRGNLVYKAAQLIKTFSGTSKGAVIHLTKRIPLGAGLGGGSSNAAATLVALNRLWNLKLTSQTVQMLAAKLGSDVPFFASGASLAKGRGRGEKLKALNSSKRRWMVLVTPSIHVSTPEVYQKLKPPYLTLSNADAKLVQNFASGRRIHLEKFKLVNALEPACFEVCPKLGVVKKTLEKAGALAALVSGSGSSVFGAARDRRHARLIAAECRRRMKFPVRVVATI